MPATCVFCAIIRGDEKAVIILETERLIEERDQPFGLQDDHGLLVAADDGAEHACSWHQPRAYPGTAGSAGPPRRRFSRPARHHLRAAMNRHDGTSGRL